MASYEQLGLFYLGKRYDLDDRARMSEPVLYDSKDLLTHAVCVGMTGSGKTGLGIILIEEAAIDGIPVLAIDPKGDLANLLLTFPDLSVADFRPWTNASGTGPDPAAADAAALEQANLWKAGLAEWDQTPDRIARLKAAAEVCVYTPGSRAATPLALLKALGAPAQEDDEDAASRVSGTASSLLTLAGLADTGAHSREHALLSAILAVRPESSGNAVAPAASNDVRGDAAASRQPGASAADLPWVVQQIQRPSFDRIGVLDLETFYPAKERQELALRFNSRLAAPGFDVWLTGQPLDIPSLLYTAAGRPRISIISIAHLGDAERMLVVSMVLNATLEWTRRQTGTTSLRALVYMDEVFGYLPPVSNPPSKLPLLTLLKQARAFGVGLVLATQNPVDLDYKALSNAGTWFLGKLQTERDKARVLDGIEGLASTMDRQTLDKALSGLQRRVFVMHNVHEQQPVVLETRWTLSYLRGPMSREELTRAAAGSTVQPRDTSTAGPTAGHQDLSHGSKDMPSGAGSAGQTPSRPRSPVQQPSDRPILPAGIQELFIRGDSATPAHYAPVLYGAARIHFVDTRRGIDCTLDVQADAPFREGAIAVDWEGAATSEEAPDALLDRPVPGAVTYGALPAAALDRKSYVDWTRDFSQWLARTRSLRLFSAPSIKLTSQPGESERDFRIRLQQSAHEARDAAVEKLRVRYAPKVQRLANKVRSAAETRGREEQQAQQQKVQSAVSIGATMLGALLGRKAVSMSTLGRATTAARGVSRSMKESQDIARADERLREAQADLQALEAELEGEISALSAASGAGIPIETVEIKPKRGAVDVRLVSLAWKPEAQPDV